MTYNVKTNIDDYVRLHQDKEQTQVGQGGWKWRNKKAEMKNQRWNFRKERKRRPLRLPPKTIGYNHWYIIYQYIKGV